MKSSSCKQTCSDRHCSPLDFDESAVDVPANSNSASNVMRICIPLERYGFGASFATTASGADCGADCGAAAVVVMPGSSIDGLPRT